MACMVASRICKPLNLHLLVLVFAFDHLPCGGARGRGRGGGGRDGQKIQQQVDRLQNKQFHRDRIHFLGFADHLRYT